MPRVVRRAPLAQRILSYLNPFDYILSIATDFDAYDWDALQQTLGDPLGIGLNILAAVARANVDAFRGRYEDDVFQTSTSFSRSRSWAGGVGYLLETVLWAMAMLSVGNAVYAMTRKRRYRLFESNIEIKPATPHARRVRIDSSPSDYGSPMKIFNSFKQSFADDPASRAHPDETRDVWELSVWDPTPLSLALLCYFSPVHMAVYYLSFPTTPTYGYPASGTSNSSTVLTVLAIQVLLSVMLRWIQNLFIQQAKDMRIINKEVLNEYDTKFVQPRVNVRKRDVAVQATDPTNVRGSSVEAFVPAYDRHGFHTAPNPKYAPYTWDSGPKGPADGIPPDSVRRSSSISSYGPGSNRNSLGPEEDSFKPSLMKRMRQPQFTKASGGDVHTNPVHRRTTMGSTTSSAATGMEDFDEEVPRRAAPAPAHDESRFATNNNYQSRASIGTPGVRRNPATTGMNGLVNWSVQQNRGLSPSKGRSPLKGGKNVHPSSYSESLGTPLGTPRRRV